MRRTTPVGYASSWSSTDSSTMAAAPKKQRAFLGCFRMAAILFIVLFSMGILQQHSRVSTTLMAATGDPSRNVLATHLNTSSHQSTAAAAATKQEWVGPRHALATHWNNTSQSSTAAAAATKEGRSKWQWVGDFRIHTDWHPVHRYDRFPTVQERVKLYMSNWYLPPCDKNSGSFVHHHTMYSVKRDASSWPVLNVTDPWNSTSKTTMFYDSMYLFEMQKPKTKRSLVLLNRQLVKKCASLGKKQIRHVHYCKDAVEIVDMMAELDKQDANASTPVLSFFGDGPGIDDRMTLFDIPFFAKHRALATKESVNAVTDGSCWNADRPALEIAHHQDQYNGKLSPIVWLLMHWRHYRPLKLALKVDTPWEKKKNRAYWRGDMTGYIQSEEENDFVTCQLNQRCRFVLEHVNSDLIDAGLTMHVLNSSIVNGIELMKERSDFQVYQEHKVLISLEGNDVASGLKWGLQSESVLVMPPPTRTSWAMEELLQPWVHYIPMKPDGSNAEEMVQWVIAHDEEARKIAERATLFIYDLVHHEDAATDDHMVKKEILQRYRALWH